VSLPNVSKPHRTTILPRLLPQVEIERMRETPTPRAPQSMAYSNGTCSELENIMNIHHGRTNSDGGRWQDSGVRGAAELLAAPDCLRSLTLYPCLPEFCNERTRSGSAVRYLSTPTERSQHLLTVVDGLLVDSDGTPLASRAEPDGTAGLHSDADAGAACGGGDGRSEGDPSHRRRDHRQEEARRAIFVMTSEHEVLYSFDTESAKHSSLACGGPIAAAGTLLVHDGRLLAIDNSSGHYRPPAASLTVLITRLQSMGVPLDHVDVTFCSPPRPRQHDGDLGSGSGDILPPRGIISAHIRNDVHPASPRKAGARARRSPGRERASPPATSSSGGRSRSSAGSLWRRAAVARD
jgi:hypothetical protein